MSALIFALNLDPFALISCLIIALSGARFLTGLWNAIIQTYSSV